MVFLVCSRRSWWRTGTFSDLLFDGPLQNNRLNMRVQELLCKLVINHIKVAPLTASTLFRPCLPSNLAAADIVPRMVLVSGLKLSSRGLNVSSRGLNVSSRSRNGLDNGADLLAGTCRAAAGAAVGRKADPTCLVLRLICPPLPTLRVRLPICLLWTAGLAVAGAVAERNALLTVAAAATASFFLVVRTTLPLVVVVMVMRPLLVFFTSS